MTVAAVDVVRWGLIILGLIAVCATVQKLLARFVFMPTGWPREEAEAIAFVATMAGLFLGLVLGFR